jgi:hypothetical protein
VIGIGGGGRRVNGLNHHGQQFQSATGLVQRLLDLSLQLAGGSGQGIAQQIVQLLPGKVMQHGAVGHGMQQGGGVGLLVERQGVGIAQP